VEGEKPKEEGSGPTLEGLIWKVHRRNLRSVTDPPRGQARKEGSSQESSMPKKRPRRTRAIKKYAYQRGGRYITPNSKRKEILFLNSSSGGNLLLGHRPQASSGGRRKAALERKSEPKKEPPRRHKIQKPNESGRRGAGEGSSEEVFWVGKNLSSNMASNLLKKQQM